MDGTSYNEKQKNGNEISLNIKNDFETPMKLIEREEEKSSSENSQYLLRK